MIQDVPAVDRAAAPNAAPASARPLVVVVDDEPGILAALVRLLRTEDCDVAATTSPWDALLWVREREVDLLVTDHAMPGMPGVELLARVGEISPKTATLLLTAHRGRVGLHPGGRRVLPLVMDKPWDDAALRGRVRGLLRRGSRR